MNFWSKLTGFFNKKERREQEAEVRQKERKWWQFWKQKPQAPEPDEVMPEEPEAPWRVDSQALLDEEAKRQKAREEERQKLADEEKKRQQYEQARDTANRRYGTNFTQEEYDNMWDLYGSTDLNQYFPSDLIIYLAEFARENDISMQRFLEILKEVAQSAAGQGWNRGEAAQQLWEVLDREVARKSETQEDYYEDLF